MRLAILGMLLWFSSGWTIAVAADVDYELELDQALITEVDETVEPVTMEVKDRAWPMMGVEQATTPLPPPRPLMFERPPVRISGFIFNDGGPKFIPVSSTGPTSLDEVVWPRTRELLMSFVPPTGSNPPGLYSFGGITLQR